MRRHVLLLILLIWCAGEVPVFAQDTVYYDLMWKQTTADKADYFRIRTKQPLGWRVTDYYLNGKTQMIGAYADDSFRVRQGEYVWYDSSGVIEHRCLLENNEQNGPETYYYPSGQVRLTGNYKDDKLNGKWIGYFSSGKLSGKAKYKKGKQVSGKNYNEDGTRNRNITDFWTESEFPGGLDQWARFLNKTFSYPDSAIEHDTEGTVIVGFKVSAEGRIVDLKVIQSVDKYLDEEALRVMRMSPNWQPFIFGGIATQSYKRQPIIFKLEN